MTQSLSWTSQYSPKSRQELTGNYEAINKLDKYMKSWKKKSPKKRAAFVHGPTGTGKTIAVQLLAKENNYDLMEINASDQRTKKKIDEILGRTVTQNVTIFGRPRMILLDEMEGVSGQKDRGGISAIANLIKITRSPIILVATTIGENMEQKFRSLRDKATLIEFVSVSFGEIYSKLREITTDKKIVVNGDILDTIAMRSNGDLRSAINDLETVASGKESISSEDITWLGERDRQDRTPVILNRIFNARSLWEARHTISQSMIPYDNLFEWIYENLPLIIDHPKERLMALQALSSADIYQKRARTSNYRLLKYMFNNMTGGVSFSRSESKGLGLLKLVHIAIMKTGLPINNFSTTETPEGIMIKPNGWLGKKNWGELNQLLREKGARWAYGRNVWILPYYREPQTKWRYIRTFHNRRRRKEVALKIANKTHTSTQKAITETLPLLKIIYQAQPDSREELNQWLELEDKEQEYMLK